MAGVNPARKDAAAGSLPTSRSRPVGGVEAVGKRAVEIQDAQQPLAGEQRNDELGAGCVIAGDVAGEGCYIGDE